VDFVIAEASPEELRATGVGGADELEQAVQYVYEWGVSSSYSEQAAAERPVKLVVGVGVGKQARGQASARAPPSLGSFGVPGISWCTWARELNSFHDQFVLVSRWPSDAFDGRARHRVAIENGSADHM
jgi:hypothetical protein